MYECMVSHIESNMNHYHAIGEVPGRSHDRMATAGVTFRAKDGYVVLAGARSEDRLRALWQTIGRDDLAEDPRFLGGEMGGEFFVDEFVPALEGWSVNLTKLEIAEKLVPLGFSMGMAQTMEELANCPHLESRRMYVDTGDTVGGTFRSPRTPVRLTGCVEPPAGTPPTLGQHNREILCSIGGLTLGELETLEAEGAL
jgi:formyl-CoA transferase